MRERIYITVADYCLIEVIKKLDDSGCYGIKLGKVDNNWMVSYYKEPVECYSDAGHSNQDDEFEQNKTELTREELEKEAEEYIKMQRDIMTRNGIKFLKEG